MGLETLRNGGQRGIHFTQTPLKLQIQGPGIQFTNKKAVMLKAPSINWPRTWKHPGMVDMTFRMEIHFTQTPLDYKSDDLGLQITAGTLPKAVISSKYQLTAPSINWLWTGKHSGMVYMTFRKQILSPQVHCPGDYNCKEKATESFYLGGF
jgi:hypothetical protein